MWTWPLSSILQPPTIEPKMSYTNWGTGIPCYLVTQRAKSGEWVCSLIDIRLLLVCKFTGIVQSETPTVLSPTAFSKCRTQNFTLEPCSFTFRDSQSIEIMSMSTKNGYQKRIFLSPSPSLTFQTRVSKGQEMFIATIPGKIKKIHVQWVKLSWLLLSKSHII